ncbi:MAG: hypothetical protein J6Y02_00960 [Pseudobutyrivibrio sp.]|nr:hypothetical protein [Pseudobutyrivibrio sp.]
MARTKGSFSLAGTLEPLVSAPLDARQTVKLKTDLTAVGTFQYYYVGMQVFAEDELKRYTLIGGDPTVAANWREDGTATDSTLYQYAGSTTFDNLPAAAAARVGYVYTITDDFTTTSDFIEGAGHDYPAGTDVAIVNNGTKEIPVYKYNALSGSLEGYQKKMQVETLPAASQDLEGEILMYVGDSTATLTNGYFYECVEDSEDPGTYIWVAKSTQADADDKLDSALSVTKTTGGINAGANYPQGTTFEKLFRDMLNPIEYPTLTNPSASITGTGDKLLEKGDSVSVTLTAALDRGEITPAYGTSGYRSGPATDYTLNGGSAQAGATFEETVTEQNASFTVVINYSQGEQPKDSVGNDYSSPLSAGSVTSDALTYEFVNALWSNTATVNTIAKNALVSASAKEHIFVFPPTTVTYPEVFDVPSSWTVTHVDVKNTLSNQWEDCSTEFTITTTTHDDAGGNSTSYDRYTCNLGYAMGSREIRIKWS